MSQLSVWLHRLNTLESKLSIVELEQGLNYKKQNFRLLTKFYRLLSPGQMMRFPTDDDWNLFKEKFNINDDCYDVITHTDPIGFAGPAPVHYNKGSENPKNYLQRNQLPPMKIEMTSIYQPAVVGTYGTTDDLNMGTPFLQNSPSQTSPSHIPDVKQDLVPRKYTVKSSLVPPVLTGHTALEAAESLSKSGYYISIVNFYCSQSFGTKTNPTMVQILAPPSVSAPVYQNQDLSNLNVGCFWFNDGRNGQIELPKDPHCRCCIIIRFKKFILT